ncbi:MAG: DoxX family protein [Bdellovibrio sp.]
MKKAVVKAAPELLARITIGWIFIESGWGKLHNLSQVVDFFNSLNIPFASVQAPFVAGLELVAGIMILVGMFTRIASLPLIAIMVVALATAKREEITDLSALLGTADFLYIVILSWLAAYGSQCFSVSKVLCNLSSKGSCKKGCNH